MALMEPIYANLECLLDKAKFVLNINSLILTLERHKRLTSYSLITQTLDQIDPKNPQHIESVCYIALSVMDRIRKLNFTLYVHYADTEEQLRSVMLSCLKAHKQMIVDLVQYDINDHRYVADPVRSHLIMLCILAKIKFEIKTPVLDRLDKLLPEMNDVAFAYCFSAIDNPDQIQAFTTELKNRLKPEKCFGIHFVNLIIGNICFRSKAKMYLVETEKFKSMRTSVEITYEQFMNLPTLVNPNFLSNNEKLKPYIAPIMSIIESYFLALQKKNHIEIIKNIYLTSLFSSDIFSKNNYRRQSYPFVLQKQSRFYLSSEELLTFYGFAASLNYFSVSFWKNFEEMIFKLDKAGILDGSCDGKNSLPPLGIICTYARVCFRQRVKDSAVWAVLEKVVS